MKEEMAMSYGGLSYFAFGFSTDKTLRDDGNIQQLLLKISETGWRFLAPNNNSRSAKRNFLADTPSSIINAWQEAIATGKNGATLDFCDSENFIAGLGLDFEHQYRKLLITTDYGDLHLNKPSSKDEENMRSLIRLCEIVYTTLSPDYGYGLTTPNLVPLNEYLDLTSHIYAVYDYNFFGKEIVKRFGHDKISEIPTWRKLEFEDGGLLLEMKPFLVESEDEYASYKRNYEVAAQVFGAETCRIGI